MRLLSNFRAPEQTEIVWHSPGDREKWAARLNAIHQLWAETERRAVALGIKPAAYQPLTRDEYMRLLPWAQRHGLLVHVVHNVAAFDGFAQQYRPGNDMFVTAIARDPAALEEPERFLGYPECCVEFFGRAFPVIVDPVWQWAGERTDLGKVSPYANPLLRYRNIRFTSHIPCSPGCEQSERIGQAMRQAMHPDVVEWTEELLTGPIEWDCYRGLAIVKTRPFRLVVGSVPCADRYVVKVN